MKNIKIILFVIIAVSVINIVGDSFIRNSFFSITHPLQRFLFSNGEKIGEWVSGKIFANTLKKENNEIIKQNLLLKKQISNLLEYKKQASIFKNALDLKNEKDFHLLFCDIVSRSPEGSILISSGKDQGVSIGMPAITEQGILIGRIEKVFKNFSTARLITSKKISFSVEIISTSTSELAIARGNSDNKIYFDLAPQKSKIRIGDLVRTTAIGNQFPEGLLVGSVKSIRKNDAEPFQKGEITPYFMKTPLLQLFLITNFAIKNGESI